MDIFHLPHMPNKFVKTDQIFTYAHLPNMLIEVLMPIFSS